MIPATRRALRPQAPAARIPARRSPTGRPGREDVAFRVTDARERVDRGEDLLDVIPEIGRRGGDVIRHGRGAGRHQRRCPEAVVDPGEQRADPATEAPADEPQALRVDALVGGEDVQRAPDRDDVLDDGVALPAEGLLRREPRRRRRISGGQRQRERHRTTRGEPRGEREQLGSVAARAVEVDDGREAAALAARGRDEHAVDLTLAARERDLTDVERTAVGELRARLEGERRVRVVREGIVVRARAAAARWRARSACRGGEAAAREHRPRVAAEARSVRLRGVDRRRPPCCAGAVLRIGRGRVRAVASRLSRGGRPLARRGRALRRRRPRGGDREADPLARRARASRDGGRADSGDAGAAAVGRPGARSRLRAPPSRSLSRTSPSMS